MYVYIGILLHSLAGVCALALEPRCTGATLSKAACVIYLGPLLGVALMLVRTPFDAHSTTNNPDRGKIFLTLNLAFFGFVHASYKAEGNCEGLLPDGRMEGFWAASCNCGFRDPDKTCDPGTLGNMSYTLT